MLRGLPSLYAVALRKVVGVRKSNYFSSLSATESGLSSNRERNQLRLINLKLSEKRNIRAAKPAREKAPRTAIGDTQVTAGPSSSHFPALGLCGDLVAALDAQG